jgi:hypothetical protein
MFRTILISIGAPLLMVLAVILMYWILTRIGIDLSTALSFAILFSPIWLPFFLFFLTFERWQYYVRTKFVVNQGRTTLRIKLPQEVFKSPEAMENIFTQSFYQNKPYNLMLAYIDGRHPLVNSYEIVAHNGEVKFYVNVPTKKFKNMLEAQFYAQYPGVEVLEEPVDYAAEVKWDPKKWEMMSFHIVKKDEDVMPIKTYVDLGLDKMPKEEEKNDPLAPLIEHLCQAQSHERIWIQILTKPELKTRFGTGDLSKYEMLSSRAKKKIDEIMQRDKPASKVPTDEETSNYTVLTPGERNLVEAIERNTSKYAFHTAIRAMYIVDSEAGKFRGDMITGLLKAFTQHDVIDRNEMGTRWRTDFDYPFISDPTGRRKEKYKQWELEDYKKRYYYPRDYVGHADKMKVMSVEELATIYHLPGKVILSPGLSRVTSQKREAPANLPVGTPTLES